MTEDDLTGMKAPRYAATTAQKMLDTGLNAFAVQLVAEAHADKPERFGDETVMLVGKAHNGTSVYMLVSTRRPTLGQFMTWPAAGRNGGMPSSQLTVPVMFDEVAGVIEVYGLKYSIDIFRSLGVGPVGSSFRVVSREGGGVTLQTLEPGTVVAEPEGAAVAEEIENA